VTIRSRGTRTTSYSGREPFWNSIIPGNAGRRRLLRCAARLDRHQPAALQDGFPGVTKEKTALGLQRLVKMLYREVPVAGPILLHHEFDPIHRRPPPRSPLPLPTDQPLGLSASYRAAQPVEYRSLIPSNSAASPQLNRPPDIALMPPHTAPSVPRVAHPDPRLGDLPKPDRSSATKASHISF